MNLERMYIVVAISYFKSATVGGAPEVKTIAVYAVKYFHSILAQSTTPDLYAQMRRVDLHVQSHLKSKLLEKAKSASSRKLKLNKS